MKAWRLVICLASVAAAGLPTRSGAESAGVAGTGASGYVFAGTTPFRDRRSADQKPAQGGALTAIEAVGSPTEFVPRTFCIFAGKDIQKVEMDSFSMTGPGKFDAANVDVSVLRWLTLGRKGTPSPELLVKDDREVLKGVFPAGPEYPSVRATGPVKTEIKAGQSKEFWVTFHIPEGAVPGTYRGSLTVTLDGEKRSIPCALEVLPIKLQKPDDMLWGIWFQIGWTDWQMIEKYLKMTAECGFNIISAPAWDDPAYGKVAGLMKKYGMNAKVLFSGCPWVYADGGNPEAFTYKGMSLTEYTRRGVEFAKTNGYPRPLMGMEDENGDAPLQKRRQALIKPGGSDNWMCVNNGWEELHKVLGYPMGNGGPWTRKASREAHRYGAGAGGYIQSWDSWSANGCQLKGLAGYGAWNLSADCYLHYTMLTFFGDPYDGTDGQYEDWSTIGCSKEGPVMTLRYAGHRAGVDDFRYVYTLVNLLEAKEKTFAADADRMNRLAMIRADLDDVLLRNAYGGGAEKDRRFVANLILKVQGI